MSLKSMQISKMISSGPSLRPSMFGSSIQPFYNQQKVGLDFDEGSVGKVVFIMGIDRWGSKNKKVGK